MDNKRFDHLTRLLATGHDRRTVLRRLLGVGAGTLAGGAIAGGAEAARRGFSGPKFPTPPPCSGGLCGEPCGSCAEGQACFEGECFAQCAQSTFDCPCGDCVVLEGTGLELCATVIRQPCERNLDCQQRYGTGWVCADTAQCLHAC